MQKKRETKERYLIQKKNKNHSPNASSIARRAGHSSTLSLLREKTILSAQISKSHKERKFVPRLRSLHARAVAFTTRKQNISVKRLLVSFANKNRAHKKKRARCSKTAPLGKNATHLNRSRSSASQTYLRTGDFKRFLYSRLCFCAENPEYFDKRESTRCCIYISWLKTHVHFI